MCAKPINLALQGGGAHGAFTWGVLDRILEGDELDIAAITGTSAGALNGAAVKAGLVQGGRRQARETLDWLWGKVGSLDSMTLPQWAQQFLPKTPDLSRAIELSPGYIWSDFLARTTSPYALGPLYRNPLEPIVAQLQYDHVCARQGPPLFVGATNVRTGKVRIFSGKDITPDAIMASACLPTLFQAVEIPDADGTLQAYWDGGYSGNPALFPLFQPHLPDDVLIVNLNPVERPELPFRPQDILNRVNEISFNASLLAQLRSIHFVQDLIESGKIPEGTMKRVLVHMIADDDLMTQLSVATKTVPSAIIINRLKAAGRVAAEDFITQHLGDVGKDSTVDLAAMYG